jgi:hypothetical protein
MGQNCCLSWAQNAKKNNYGNENCSKQTTNIAKIAHCRTAELK